MSFLRCLVLAILVALPTIAARTAHAGEAPPPFINPEHGATEFFQEATLLDLASHRDLLFTEQFDLGTALFLEGRYPEAALVYRIAAGKATHDADRVAALLTASQALAMSKQAAFTQQAAQLANEAQRIMPLNPKIAYVRVARWTEAGDLLEVQAARSMLERFNLKENGTEVLEPMTMVTIAVVAGVITYLAGEHGYITPKERAVILYGILVLTVAALPPGAAIEPLLIKATAAAL